jgi:hypothetical protein
VTLLAGSRAAERIAAAMDATPAPIGPQGPAFAPVDDPAPYVEPVGAESPFYSREWRGGPLYVCPAGESCFSGRTHRSIIRHISQVHDEPEPSVETRARRTGIILARG